MSHDPRQYHRGTVGPLTYLNAVRAISGMELPWKDICHRYMDGTTAGACAQENMESDAQLLCEAWDFLERMPEPTDMPRQAERESLLIRLRAWGKDLQS
jgi:hypothetical protein